MKKSIKYFCFLFVCVLCAPLFAACNASGATVAKGVRFTQKVYEIDRKVPVKLEYVVYPSTAANYTASFDCTASHGVYSYEKGYFTITDEYEDIPDIEATITVDNYSDTCIIKLIKYPTDIYFESSDVTINKNGAVGLQLFGTIDGETDKSIDFDKYNIEYVSSNPSVVRIEGNTAISTGKPGSVTISARLKDTQGNYVPIDRNDPLNLLYTETTITVVENVAKAYVTIEGNDSFLTVNANNYNQQASNTYQTNKSSLKMSVMLYSEDGVLLNPEDINIQATSASASIATVAKQSDNTFTISFVDGATTYTEEDDVITYIYTRIEVTSSAISSNGIPVRFVFFLTKLKPA
ncbi:MAG: hypothetical protein IJ542_00730 [Clostridia bacterium]|nr:hypothetical protein [Clostridia bacterium]